MKITLLAKIRRKRKRGKIKRHVWTERGQIGDNRKRNGGYGGGNEM